LELKAALDRNIIGCCVLPEQLTDEQLLSRANRGDHDAFAALYDRRHGAIYRFALQMTGRLDIAEDVTQETFVALAHDLSRFDASRGTPAAYLYGVARNLLLRRIESSRETPLDEAQSKVTTGAGPLAEMLHTETVEAVRRAVLALPPNYREAVVLCDLQELSYEQAAAVIGCPVGTVRSKLNRGRALLAGKLRAARGCFA
jgi:RNA polymerase sigma-70 factor (ECF subfamily)